MKHQRPQFTDPWQQIHKTLGLLKHALESLEAKTKRVADNPSLKPMEVKILQLVKDMDSKLDELLAEVEDETTVVESVDVFVSGLKQQLADALAGETPAIRAKVAAIIDRVHANKTKLASAIVNNTPAEPETPADA